MALSLWKDVSRPDAIRVSYDDWVPQEEAGDRLLHLPRRRLHGGAPRGSRRVSADNMTSASNAQADGVQSDNYLVPGSNNEKDYVRLVGGAGDLTPACTTQADG